MKYISGHFYFKIKIGWSKKLFYVVIVCFSHFYIMTKIEIFHWIVIFFEIQVSKTKFLCKIMQNRLNLLSFLLYSLFTMQNRLHALLLL